MGARCAPDVVVIGAGVIGLSTAVCPAERGQRVEVRARLAPAQTTSAVASAMIGPALAPADDPAGRRERASIAEFTALAEVAGTGVTLRRGRLATRDPLPPLGARELTGDESVTPVRGQHVIVDNPGLTEFFIEAPFTPEWAAYWPYPDHVVLGGTQSAEDTSTEPDPEIAEQILRRCVEVEPRLGHARVRGHQVGLRPARPAVRLEAEQIGRARCVHNYGHGGSGVTLSWGSAFTAVALLLDG